MASLLALAVAAADQENVDPSIDIIANVCSSARGVRAAYDGSAKETRKWSRGGGPERQDDLVVALCPQRATLEQWLRVEQTSRWRKRN